MVTAASAQAPSRRRALDPTTRRPRGLPCEPGSIVADTVAIVVAYLAALLWRFGGTVTSHQVRGLVVLLPIAVALHLAWQARHGCHGRDWRGAGAAGARDLVAATAGAGVTTVTVAGMLPTLTVPRSVAVGGATASVLLLGALRLRHRPALRRVTEAVGVGTHADRVVRP